MTIDYKDLVIWKCPICKVTFSVHPEPSHVWSKENHLLSCGLKHEEKKNYPTPNSTQHFGEPSNNRFDLSSKVESIKELNLTSLMYVRWALFGAIIADVFGIYWALGLKMIATALLVIFIVALALTFVLENRRRALGDKEPKKIDLGLKNIGKDLTKGMKMDMRGY